MSTRCLQCGQDLPPPARTGPRRKFCPGGQCARRYHNDRQAEREGRDPATIKRRGSRPRLPRSSVCLHCGVSLEGTRRHRFCSDEHAELWTNAQRSKGIHETYHWLSDVDETTRTATCSQCGPGVPILSAGRKRNADGSRKWKCRTVAVSAHNRHSRWVSDWRKRGILLTVERFEAMLEEQQNACAVCDTPFPANRRPAVDHDHRTKQVRGILCDSCNLGLGKFADDPARLRAAAVYLERYAALQHGDPLGQEATT